MAKLGRNDPCPCGSGKKYKNCHLPIEEAQRSELLLLRRAVDTLMPKLLDHARAMPEAVADAFTRYWDSKYEPAQLAELDDMEDRGADRFMTWFAFDYRHTDGQTLVEQLVADPALLELNAQEATLLPAWPATRMRPYIVESIEKGDGVQLRDMLEDGVYPVEDHAASRRVQIGEVLVAHLVPAAGRYYLAGAAAHLTEDTREKLREFVGMHLEAYQRDKPDAEWPDFLIERSDVFNHFVMQLPVEQPDPTLLDKILLQTRVALQLTGESLGITSKSEQSEKDA
jgi:SEC-C motif